MKFSCRIFVICILAFISLLHLSCGAGKQDGAKTKKLGFVAIAAADFWTIARKGAEKADRELDDVTLDFRIPTDGTAAEQKRLIDDLLAKGIDGLAISPVDPVNQTQMINEVAKQVLVLARFLQSTDEEFGRRETCRRSYEEIRGDSTAQRR